MPRISQQLWFCFAAIWLAGSISMYWSVNVGVAQSAAPPADLSVSEELVKRWLDLDSFTTQTQFLQTTRPRLPPDLPQGISLESQQKFGFPIAEEPFSRNDKRLVSQDRYTVEPPNAEVTTSSQQSLKPRSETVSPVLFEVATHNENATRSWFSGGIELSQ